MSDQSPKRKLTRRDFIKIGGGTALTAAGIRYLPQIAANAFLASATSVGAATRTFHLVGTDGFIALPGPAGGITANNPPRVIYLMRWRRTGGRPISSAFGM
jgi:tetrahydromethanopterin S-methyltransferase subunit D